MNNYYVIDNENTCEFTVVKNKDTAKVAMIEEVVKEYKHALEFGRTINVQEYFDCVIEIIEKNYCENWLYLNVASVRETE